MPMRKPSTNAEPTLPIQDDDHIAGPDTAAVTVVAYCDFECPSCGRAYPLIKRLQVRLEARLRFVFRHFPLNQKHPLTQQAVEAIEEASAQGAQERRLLCQFLTRMSHHRHTRS